MYEPDFWTQSADAMQLSIEGNRLIVRELADLAGSLWRRTVAGIETLFKGQRHQLPRV